LAYFAPRCGDGTGANRGANRFAGTGRIAGTSESLVARFAPSARQSDQDAAVSRRRHERRKSGGGLDMAIDKYVSTVFDVGWPIFGFGGALSKARQARKKNV